MRSGALPLTVAVVAAMAALLCAAAPVPPRPSGASPLPYKGMTFTNERYCPNVSLASAAANRSMAHLATTGANAVSIVVTQYQKNTTSTDIYAVAAPTPCTTTPNGWCVTATDAEVAESIAAAHAKGFKVMLKLQIDLMDAPGLWRGDIGINMTDTQWSMWFDSYRAAILRYARIAERMGVHMLSVSCELVEASKQEALWRGIVDDIRMVYSGVLIDSANWSAPGGSGEVTDKKWWDAVDVIGVDEYYMTYFFSHGINGTNGTTTYRDEATLLHLWRGVEEQLEGLHRKFNRSVVFSEIGFCSGDDGNCWRNKPANAVPSLRTTKASLEAQAVQYEAALKAFSKHPWWLGVFWWNWATDPNFGGPGNSCMDPKFKPAESVLRRWYNATQPQPPLPTEAPACRCWL
jgi:hypothetical protein